MNQIPCVPMTPYVLQQQATFMPVPQQPQKLNAVNIEINNPSVGAGQQAQQPTAPIYQYPQVPYYTYPTTQTVPVCYPPVQVPTSQPPVTTQVPTTQPAPAPVPAPTTEQAPVTQPVPVQQPVVVNGPQINNNAPTVPNVVDTTAQPTPEVPAPVVSTPGTQTVEQKPEVVPADTVAPQVDIDSYINKLANPDFDVQSATMEEIANLAKNSPEKATELLVPKLFESLANIVNFDASKLAGPTKEQLAAREKIVTGKEVTDAEKQLANEITPQEQAERNKSFALFTTAIMDKLYLDEVARLSNQPVPLTDVPGLVTIVDNLKDNSDPLIRASAIEALSFIQRPEYKKDLATVFTVATNDSDPNVAEAAKVALSKLDKN